MLLTAVVVLILIPAIVIQQEVRGCSCESSSRDTLLALYNATQGPSWRVQWNLDLLVCTWSGVVCNDANGLVSKINLTNHQLRGTLPSAICELVGLQELVLSRNNLTGTIPVQLANCAALWNLDLSWNQLTGTLPPQLSTFRGHQMSVWFSNNLLTGTLPPEYRAWSAQYVYLSGNSFTGTIPAVYSEWGAMLQTLKLAYNQLTGTLPHEFSNFSRMKELDISFNRISGSIPRVFGNWKGLQFLRFQGNRLSGTLPPQFGAEWPNVTIIHLFQNSLSGSIPAAWSAMGSLQALSLIANNFTGSLPAAFSKLPKAQVLSFDQNQLSGTLPESWGELRPVVIGLQSNPMLRGPIPRSWAAGMFSPLLPIAVLSVCGTNLCMGDISAASLMPAMLSCIPNAALINADDLETVLRETLFAGPVTLPSCFPATSSAPNRTTLELPPLSPSAAARAETTSTVVMWGALAVSCMLPTAGGAAVTQLGALQSMMGALRLRQRCYASSAPPVLNKNGTGGSEEEETPSILERMVNIGDELQDNPTSLTIGGLGNDGSTSLALASPGGTVVGNLVIVFAHAAVFYHLISGVVIPRLIDALVPGGDRDIRRATGDVRRTLGMALQLMSAGRDAAKHFPGSLARAYVFVLQPSVTACVVLMAIGTSAEASAAVALGAVGGVAWMGLFFWFLWRLAIYDSAWLKREFPCTTVAINDDDASLGSRRHRGRRCSPLTRRLQRLGDVLWSLLAAPRDGIRWVPRRSPEGNSSTGKQILQSYGVLFEGSRCGWRLFFVLDMGSLWVSGVILGVCSSITSSPCATAQWGGLSLAVVSAIQLVVFAFARPLVVPGENIAGAVGAAFAMSMEIVSAAGDENDDGSVSAALTVTSGSLQLMFLVISSVASCWRLMVERRNRAAAEGGANSLLDCPYGREQHPNSTSAKNNRSRRKGSPASVPRHLTSTTTTPEDTTSITFHSSTGISSPKLELQRIVLLICKASADATRLN